jgi:hypothetical protein
VAITHVNTQFGTPNSSSSPGITSTSVVTKPTGLAVGDVMVAIINANKAGITAPSVRWTRLSTNDAGTNLYRMEVWYCVATSSETGAASFTWSNGDANAPMWAAIAAYRGVNQSSPINVSGVNTGTTANPQSTPALTSTTTGFILRARTIRTSSGTGVSFSSPMPSERFDKGNNSTVGYWGALYDDNAEVAAGTVLAEDITRASGTQTDTFTTTIVLATANSSIAGGKAAATADANDATVGIGQSVNAGRAQATAAAKQPSALAGKVVNSVGVAQATAAVPDTARFAQATRAAVTAAVNAPNLFFGTPSYRLKTVESDTYPVVGLTGIPQRRITVEQE